jgi:Alpha/beta hydrolase family
MSKHTKPSIVFVHGIWADGSCFSKVIPTLDGTAWRSKPSWYIVANKDRTVQPELQRFVAKRMGAAVFEVESSHVPMLSNPGFVIDVIRAAAQTVRGSRVKASR